MRSKFVYAAGLAVLGPLIAEVVASSNTPAILFPVLLPFLILIYGLPTLLIRELWVRCRIGWPGFLMLGAAYSAFNEGVIAATWFKINSENMKVLVFTAAEAGRANGVNWAVMLNLTVYHTLWSILIPIVLMEAWARHDRARPWLPRWAIGLAIAVVVFVMLGALSEKATDRVCDAPTRQIFDECVDGRRGAAVFIVVAVVVALLLPRWRARPRIAKKPGDRTLVGVGVVYSLAFLVSYFVLPLSGRPGVAEITAVLLLVVAVAAVLWSCRDPYWNLHAGVLVVTGMMLPGMITSIRAFAVLQPVAVALFIWFFLRKVYRRTV